MAEAYRDYDPYNERTVLLLIVADVVAELYEDQRNLTAALIMGGRTGGFNADVLMGEIDRTIFVRERLEGVLHMYDALADILSPDEATDTGL